MSYRPFVCRVPVAAGIGCSLYADGWKFLWRILLLLHIYGTAGNSRESVDK